MADKIDPSGSNSISTNLLPKYYRTDANKKFLQATVDQLIQPGTVKKVNGFIGRQNSKSTTGADIFVKAPTSVRQDYQLEPSLVINDTLGNTTFFKDYQDYINQLSIFGANTDNHARMNSQEFYSWDPHIEWDKFVNFQNYYWLPYGPDVIKISGQQEKITSTYTVSLIAEANNNAYLFFPDGGNRTENPTLKLYRGQTYRFEISSIGNPFSIKTKRTSGIFDRYETPDITGHAVEEGIIELTIPYNSPDVLYYVSESDVDVGGVLEILSVDNNTVLDIDIEIIGKKTYKLPDGTNLSNGMKVSFVGQVSPASYATGQYYVEGVGTAIQLVNESILELVSTYTDSQSILFDSTPFDTLPFSDATSLASSKDYVVINRGSFDHSPWSRYNRWFHKDVIEASAKYNGKVSSIDQTSRAVRPIIEFEANLRLYNFGTEAIPDIDLIDTYTTDVFSNVEGQLGYNIDGISLAQGQRILFTAETDVRVKNKIYKVDFLILDGVRVIHLVDQGDPVADQVVLVKQGIGNQGLMYWYDGSTWTKAQQKTKVNQQPLFDIVDDSGLSYADKSVYDGSTFTGTTLFSYKVGTGANDTTLGFPLSYKNINNIGDIVFNFNIATDSFQYKNDSIIVTKNTNIGYLVKTQPDKTKVYVNGWKKTLASNTQAAVRIYKDSNKLNNFDIDVFDNVNDLLDLTVRIYVNGIRLDPSKWSLIDNPAFKQVKLATDIKTSDVLTIKAFAKQPINSNGYYEIPINLQNNPMNNEIGDFTLGEVLDHVNSIIENIPLSIMDSDDNGDLHSPEVTVVNQTYDPDYTNIRDLGNVTPYGTRFVQHSGPASLSLYHITSENNNIIRALEQSRDDYNRFKRHFISVAGSLGVTDNPINQVNLILQEINRDKPKTFPYYFSDMIPFNGSIKTDLTVVDYRIKTYPLTNTFNLESLSSQAVLVYLNGEQLLYKKDYTFDSQGFVVISATIANDDVITIYEFENTNGCFVPPTPTKLGIWPKYEPKIYLDTSLLTPRMMIQGHDGSQIASYGDYRDDIILELEKRIYNNIKIVYDTEIFDIHDLIPGYNRETPYSLTEFNQVLSSSFYKWVNTIDSDFTKPLNFDSGNSLTFNYRELSTPDGQSPLPGYWKGIYRWMLDTDRPNICPWEMLGFTEEPSWWQDVYGPAPYTSNNLVLWQDLSDGIIRQPGHPSKQIKKFVRPYVKNHIPVDEFGRISSPLESGLAKGTITNTTSGDFVFGDVSPVESAWRRSSHYPFSSLIAFMLLQPSKTFGTLLDRSRVIRNLAGQLIYKDTGLRITPVDIVLPSIYSSTSNVKTSGIINYIVDYILSDNLKSYNQYSYDMNYLSPRLSHRIGGFTSKEKFNLLLDSKTPLTSGSVFVPQEDYDIVLNSSSPVKKIIYSGVIVTKFDDGFGVKGYSNTQPYFKYYEYTKNGITLNVGGISESYVIWATRSQFSAGKIISFSNRYYRVKTLHTTTEVFNPVYYDLLPSLPIVGGVDAYIRQGWDRTNAITVPYGTKFKTIQDVVDFLLGYGEYLKDQGFIFDDYNTELQTITNWETSAKEFLFWTTQNWSSGQDKWEDWLPDQPINRGTIVRYNGDYFEAINNLEPSAVFVESDYAKLDGLSNIGSSVISLSPSAAKLTFSTPLCVVDDIRNPFNGYEIFKVDGTQLPPNFLNNYREDNTVSYTPLDGGIYGATFYLVQKEQVVILKNTTLFNDTIYNPESGYRQERIKVAGYISNDWKGDFNIPGFIFDQAVIQDWTPWQDYSLGDIVKYKQFYYSAQSFLPGVETFNSSNWIKLDKKPTAQLLPNWTYKATQFTDFYSLDSDNFDASQQQVAQHLIGYQKRQYLSNIIQDDVSEFKFYQGMIVEKGTQNVLNKLFDVLSAEGKESITFYEEWALRVGQYGASAAFENIEFVIDEQAVKNNPQGFELVNQVNTTVADFISRQTPNDIYVKPIGYNNNPWPIVSNYTPYLRTPGYVRSSDVKLTLKTIDDLLTQPISDFIDGDYVWIGFESREWNVYRYTNLNLKVNNLEFKTQGLILTAEFNISNLSVGDVIGIDQASDYTGFYRVKSINLTTVTLEASFLAQPKTFVDHDRVTVAHLVSQRTSSIDSANPVSVNTGELLWTDDSGDGKWATWQFTPAYNVTEFTNSSPTNGLAYGRKLLLNNSGDIAVISTNVGELIVYDKTGASAPWLQRQTITAPFISTDPGFGNNPTPATLTGDILALSSDSQWLATSTPLASDVCNNFVGVWQQYTDVTNTTLKTYYIGNIVTVDGQPYQATATATGKDPLVTTQAYSGITGTSTVGSGVGAVFNIVSNKTNYSATVSNAGNNYAVGDQIRIFGSTVGGSAPANNITITVISIVDGASLGPIASISVSGNAKIFWKNIPYIPVDSTGSNSNGFTKQGVVSIYKKDANNIFSLVDTILSPNPTANEKFGSNLVFGDNVLLISAEGYNSDTGIVYKMNYQSIVETSTSYNPVGSSGTTVVLSSTTGIQVGSYLRGTGFTSNQYVAQVNSLTNSIIINAAPDSEPNGVIEFVEISWRYDLTGTLDHPLLNPGDKFGTTLSMSFDNSTLAVSSQGFDPGSIGEISAGNVYVYKLASTGYGLLQTITSTEVKFGLGLTVSDTGEYIAISSVLTDKEKVDQGTVLVYQLVDGAYELKQELSNPKPEASEFFGTNIKFMNDYETIVVYSQGADNTTLTTVNTYVKNYPLYTYVDKDGNTQTSIYVGDPSTGRNTKATTFDNNLTKFLDKSADSGRVDIYDMYNTKWIFSESLASDSDNSTGYSTGLAVGANQILVGAPYAMDQGYQSGKVYSYRKTAGSLSWKILHKENNKVDLTKIKRAFLYNKVTNKLVSYLDVIDSTQGKIPGVADQEIKFKTFYDPAIYSTGTSEVNVDDGMAWTKPYVGTLWWDLRTAKFFDSHDESLVYRNSTWNTIFPGASIDVYEWVETRLTPDQWNALADTEEGITVGVSGTSLYSNATYSVVRKYDNISKTFKNTYYYWVKNKKTVPNVPNRKLSAQDVVDLIENPRGYGYRYLALTGSNSFSLVNVRPLLHDKDIVLSVEYWTSPYTDKNIHSQWKIINSNSETTLPSAIEQKWFDSLCGKDAAGRLVPDPSLPAKLKYGVEVRPRQGMFINRFEALKQFIEETNRVLINELIVENKNISLLDSYEKEPSTITGLYDSALDTDLELRFANIGTYGKPSLTPIIVDGRITGINILEKGSGYLIAPYFTITGVGIGAKVRAKIDVKGQIVGYDVISSGEGYTDNTLVTVRNYSVLVHSDSVASGAWSIYAYEPSTQVWSRVQTQNYDVRKYWNYADWYATGYNEFTAVDFSINSLVEINNIESSIGQLVKVRTTSLGTWVLLKKYANSTSVDWTQSYSVIGRQQGTIQLSPTLYDFSNSPYGFDSSLYDSSIFDNSAAVELRIILDTLKNNILTDTLRQSFLNLFFSSVRYAYSEQNYIDWIFKTSFVKAQHSVGDLKQKVTYNNDNLENFEDYINEVKPYRTKIREFVSAYSKLEQSSISTTDFDIPAVYENNTILPINTKIVNGVIQADNNKITEYPWKHWYDNLGYSVTNLTIVDGGSGYVNLPNVRFVGNTGSGATARAFITNGKVNRIVLLTKGSGYLTAPRVVIDGGVSATGTPARVVAIIGDGVVRSNLVKMKFDRTSQQYFITSLEQTETFIGTGSRLQFPLIWSPDVRIGKSSVLIKGVEALRSSYTLSTVKSTVRGYTAYSGAITFDVAPAKGIEVTVNYIKDWSLLNAADRIQHYYNPAVGELGKDLAQLMTGVDYGGVNIHGLNFDITSGWGSVPYYTDKWDSFDSTFDDYIVTVASNTHDFVVPYVPPVDTQMNVYYSGKHTDSYVSDGYSTVYNFNVYDIYPPAVTVYTELGFDDTSSTNVLGSNTITMDSVDGIQLGDTVTTFEPSGLVIATTATTNKITLDTVVGLHIGDYIKLKGVGFGGLQVTGYYIKTIVGNQITVSLIHNGTTFAVSTVNTALSHIKPMEYSVVGTFALNTIVTEINTTTKQVKLNQILFKAIKPATTARFTRTLIDPTDCTINPNGTVVLNNPIPENSTLDITAYIAPVRLDDSNYDTTGAAKEDLDIKKSQLLALELTYAQLLDQKDAFENSIADFNSQLYTLQLELNSLNIILAGMDISNPNYASIVSQINILVGTSIPFIQAELDQATADLATVNGDIATNISNRATKTTQVTQARALYTSLPPIQNETAIMQTAISDGIADNAIDPTYKTFSIPDTFVVHEGDKFIWRKSSSDGSVKPQEADYDTALSGGNLAYSTATGLSADDIIVDGDGFVTPTSSPATEEVVPGQVVDTVAIKVYDRPNTGSAQLKVDSYIADGETTEFNITQQPNSPTAVIVKFTEGQRDVDGVLLSMSEIKTLYDDYTIDYKNKKVVFTDPPTAGKLVSIFSFGFNGSDILDLDYFIGDGTTTEFITKAPWVKDVTYLVYVNGQPAEPGTPELFKTDSSYDSANRFGIKFSVPPLPGSLINYIIVSGTQQTFSITKTERLVGNGSSLYNLEYKIGDSLPVESSMLVRVNQDFLKGPNNSYYKIKGNQLNYPIDPAKFLPYSIAITDVFVYADSVLLASGIDYTVDISGITVKLAQTVRQKYLGKTLIVSIKQLQGYVYIPPTDTTGPQIQFSVDLQPTDVIEVISGYKHDILDIQTTAVNVSSKLSITPDTAEFYNYRSVAGGILQLDRTVLDDNYIWLFKNGVLQTPSVDFILNDNKTSLTLASYPALEDEFTMVTFGSNILISSGISYMQFKDMLNRTHYKRLNANKLTKLVNNLNYTDVVIEVEDASTFDAPSIANNKPGIIEIRGERVEFFTLTPKVEGNVTTYLLGQIRRGTLGTGVSRVHKAGSYVQDIGASETLPYTETTVIEQVKSDGTNIIPLTFVPTLNTSSISTWLGQYGYVFKEEYKSNVAYNVNDIITFNNLYYYCVKFVPVPKTRIKDVDYSTANTDYWALADLVIPVGYGQSNDIEVFVGGYASVPWVTGASYKVDDIVEVGSYTYRCVTEHTSSQTFTVDSANWTFFVGNIRLKKKPYKVHNVNIHPESAEGDVLLDAEFAVDGTSKELRLTHKLSFGTRVTVVKRTLTLWDGYDPTAFAQGVRTTPSSILTDDSKISRFLKAAPGIWYSNIGKYENRAGLPISFDNTNGTFDNTSITFDQG
jgi:hypothetical protein